MVESDGVLFGTTYEGGNNNAGTIFSINPDGSNFQYYSLTGEDASGPTGSLTVIGNDLFGSNQYGGSGGGGDIFKISKSLTGYSVIHTFANNMNDGGITSLLALQLWNNKLYGDTSQGGDNGQGTLFSMNLDGSDYSLLHEFSNAPYDGRYLLASPLIADGVMYGVTYQGGASDSGTMYTMTVGGSDSSNIFVSSIVVSSGSTTSVVNGNTLQMNATILPTNASNSNVSWSVTNGTGSATIDSSGLLTATDVGTVTVTASAADESGVTGTEQITIATPTCPTISNAATYNAYPTCGAASCNSGYELSGGSCVAGTCPTISNAATYNAYPTCGAASCNSGYELSGGSCVAGTCPTISNAATYNAYPTCGVATCQTGYALTNGNCVASGGGGGGGGYYIPPVSNQDRIAQLQVQIAALQAQIAVMTGNPSQTTGSSSIPAGFTFTKRLQLGTVAIDVKYLQIILNSDKDTQVASSGKGSKGHETTKFGPATYTAVKKFQQKYASEILIPQGFKSPTGVVAEFTIKKLNSMLAELNK